MSDDKYKAIFSKNLKYYMGKNRKTQSDLIKDLNLNRSSISSWVNGTRLPRMDKVDKLAKYFGIKRSDLIEENKTNDYYLNPETKKIAQEVYQNPELQILFDASKNASPEDLKLAAQMLERMKKGDDPGDD